MSEPETLKEILERTFLRYLDVRPGGLEIDGRLHPETLIQVSSYGAARTLYRGRRPLCRSLDGEKPLDGSGTCAGCHRRKNCTPQVRMDLLLFDRPFRLLLSFTSAKNFLLYASGLARRGCSVEAILTRLQVIDRGTWGELRFSEAPSRAADAHQSMGENHEDSDPH